MKLTNEFEENKYITVLGMVENPEMLFCPVPEERGEINYSNKNNVIYTPPLDKHQVKGSLSRYNFPPYKELYYLVKAEVESMLDMDLHPTYYYDRFYFVGQELKKHIDRPACEISVSLQISTNSNKPWPIWFKNSDGTESSINMKNGDAVIYKGCEIEHWRNPLPSRHNRFYKMFKKDDTYHHQIFFHFVNANGPYVEYAFDKGC